MNYFRPLVALTILGLLIPWASAQTDIPGTMKADNFTSSQWAQTLDHVVINNSRLYLDQFNTSGGLYEDLTEYQEYEESLDYITDINETHVRAKCDLQYGRYLGIDGGSPVYYENFTYRFAVYTVGRGNGGLNDVYYFHLNNRSSYGDRTDVIGTQDTFIELRILNDNDGDNWDIQFFSRTENTDIVQSSEVNVPYYYHNWIYCELFKTGSFVGANVYKWANYTGEIFAYNGTHTRSDPFGYRFLYPVNTVDTNLYPGFWIDVWVKNVDLNLTHSHYYDTGNLYTVDLSANETAPDPYSFIWEGQTSAQTSIEAFISGDNSTWSEITPENYKLLSALNYSSVYVWFRLNTTNPSYTPYVDYYHVFIGGAGGGGLTYWYGIAVVLLILGLLLGIGIRSR